MNHRRKSIGDALRSTRTLPTVCVPVRTDNIAWEPASPSSVGTHRRYGGLIVVHTTTRSYAAVLALSGRGDAACQHFSLSARQQILQGGDRDPCLYNALGRALLTCRARPFALRPPSVARDLGWCDHDYPRWGGHACKYPATSPCASHRLLSLGRSSHATPTATGLRPFGCPGPVPLAQRRLTFVENGGRHPTVPHSPPRSHQSTRDSVKNHSFCVYSRGRLDARVLCL